MGREKTPRKTKRRATPKRRRVTMWLDTEIADKLAVQAAHRKCDQGMIVEEHIRGPLGKFYVVDGTSPVAPPQLGVVDGSAAGESAA
jgi:hypothetical protein